MGKGQQEMPTLLAIIPATVARARFSEHLSVRELWTPWVLGLNTPGGPPPPPPLASHGSNQRSLPEFPAMGPHPPGRSRLVTHDQGGGFTERRSLESDLIR